MPMDCERDGEAGRGGSFDARLVDDWLPCGKPIGCVCWLSSVGEIGLLAPLPGRLEAPLSRAFL